MKSSHLDKIYVHFIKPHYDYCDVLYSSASAWSLSKLDQTQYKAALLVSGCLHGSNREKVFTILNWKTLTERRCERIKIFMSRVENGRKPDYVLSIFRKFKNEALRNNRNSRPYIFPAKISEKTKKSPVYNFMTNWNKVPVNLRSINSLSLFKSKITYREPVTKTSTVILKNLTRNEEIYLNKLRVDFLLNSHLYAHNFVGVTDPNCSHCNVINTSTHFLHRCSSPIHRPRINTLLAALQQLQVLDTFNRLTLKQKTNFLIYGYANFDLQTNSQIIKLTAKFSLSYFKFH